MHEEIKFIHVYIDALFCLFVLSFSDTIPPLFCSLALARSLARSLVGFFFCCFSHFTRPWRLPSNALCWNNHRHHLLRLPHGTPATLTLRSTPGWKRRKRYDHSQGRAEQTEAVHNHRQRPPRRHHQIRPSSSSSPSATAAAAAAAA